MNRFDNTAIREQQRCLAALTYYRGPIDGIWGVKSIAALSDFTEYHPDINDADLTAELRRRVFAIPVSDYDRPDDLADTLKRVCESLGRTDLRLCAYMMATVEHETAGAFYPVGESFYIQDRDQRQRYLDGKDYSPYFGRGLVQLTWQYNYKKYADILQLPLLENPDLALEPAISLFILVHGMLTGTYTGKELERYINPWRGADYVRARKVVNGMDKAEQIAKLAQKWESHYV